ncbi:MAG: PHP domain-containing protein, partial [Peptostreptococcaceae bacterium]
MKILIDLHTHTIVSGHAYSTVEENIKSAKEKGLKYLGMSE